MSKIYLPTEYVNNCNVVYGDYIRSYTNNQRTAWVDIYFKNGYILKPGSTNYSQTIVCDNLNTYTDNPLYKYNSDVIYSLILVISLVFAIFLVLERKC